MRVMQLLQYFLAAAAFVLRRVETPLPALEMAIQPLTAVTVAKNLHGAASIASSSDAEFSVQVYARHRFLPPVSS